MKNGTARLSRLLRTDVDYLKKNGSWLWLGQLVTVTIGFMASVLYANLLDPTDLGTYQFIITLGGFFGIFSLTGMGTSLVRTVARGGTGVMELAVSTYLRWSFGTILLASLTSAFFYWQGNVIIAGGVISAAACIPLMRAYSLYIPYLHGQKKFQQSAWLGVIGSTIPTLAVVGAVFITSNPLYLAITSFFSSTCIAYGLYHYVKWCDVTNSSTSVTEMISYSKHLSLMKVLGSSVSYVERILLFAFTSPAILAAYHFASLVPNQCKDVDRVLKKLLLPKLSEQEFSVLKKTLPRKVFIYFTLMLVIATAYIFLAPFFFDLVFPQYAEYVIHSQVLVSTILFQPITVFSRALTAHMKKRAMYIQSTIVPIFSLIILAILVPTYGLWGVIFSALARGAVNNIVVTYFFVRTK